MIDENAYNKKIAYLQKYNPKIVDYFKDIILLLDKYIEVEEKIINSAGQLAIVSNYLYLNNNVILHSLKKDEFIIFADLVYELFQIDYWYCETVLSHYPDFSFPINEISRQIYRLANSLKSIKKGKLILQFCFGITNKTQLIYTLKLFDTIGFYSPGFLIDFLNVIQNKLKNLPWEIFKQWSSRGMDLITSSRVEEAVSFFKLESRNSRRMLNHNYVVLADMKNILNIYSSSLAGKTMSILDLELSSFGLKTPYTDGKSVFLPSEIKYFKEIDLNERIYTALSAHQAAAISMGTYSFNLKEIDFLGELRDRYGTQLPSIIDNVRKHYRKRADSIRELP